MSSLDQLTRGLSAQSRMADAAADYARHALSYVFEAFAALVTLGLGVVGIEAWHRKNRKLHRRDFARAAPGMLVGLHKQLTQAKYSGGSIRVRYGDDMISIFQHAAGVEFMDEASGKSRMFPGQDFRSLASRLAREIEADPDRYGRQAACIASIVSGDPAVRAGGTLVYQDIDSLNDSLMTRLQAVKKLPADGRVGLLQALARTMPQRRAHLWTPFQALYDARADLSPRDRRTLLATLATFAPWLFDANHCMAAWKKCFVEISQINYKEPNGRGAALAALAGSVKACMPPNMALLMSYEDTRHAVCDLSNADPHKGVALAKLAWSAGHLPRRKATNFMAILASVVGLDSTNPEKGGALYALAHTIRGMPEKIQQTAFGDILSSVEGLSSEDAEKGASISALAHSMGNMPLSPDPTAFKRILQAVARLDAAENSYPGHALAGLAKSIPRLPESEQMAAFETVVAATSALGSTDVFKGRAVMELLSVCKDMSGGALPIAFNAILPAFLRLRLSDECRLRALFLLGNVIRRLPKVDQDAAWKSLLT